ncbi:hypothetical protein PR048_004926 [Dryococelus australis]|uniref:RNA-directed DNA polymerase n=1 Tax=Dryococelus australis TaxID=614101 RepID=A0ABQ9I6T5_9NEOP|nr:hypothetical protein PR048_004926 [Dryococelus australis]
MSRLPSTAPVGVKLCNFLYLTMPLVSPDKVAQETKKDPVLSKVIKVCENGWPHHCSNKILKPFFTVRHQLSIRDWVLLNGNRIVIPQSLQAKVLSILHHDHTGVVHTCMLARSCMWWKDMDEDICRISECCPACHQTQNAHTSFQSMLKCLLEVFARFAFPRTIVYDNGPPFCARDLAQFCRLRAIKLLFTPPYNPSSNGLAERSVQTFKKLLTRSLISHPSGTLSLNQRLNDCLLRIVPHPHQ